MICESCRRFASWLTRRYTRRNGQPITFVQMYRERHAQRAQSGQRWVA